MTLDTTDGTGILAYAGLGATPRGTQPSDWMSAVLRGHSGLTFEQALGVLAGAANTQLPKYLASMSGGAHFILVPAFIRGIGARLYSIDNVVDRRTREHRYRFTRHEAAAVPRSRPPRIGLGGTGGMYLAGRASEWPRALLSLVKAHDRGKASDHVVADHLAGLNLQVHCALRDKTVGPRCIVVWCRRQDRPRPGRGGGHQSYTGVVRDRATHALPSIGNGMDIQAIVGLLFEDLQSRVCDRGFRAAFEGRDMAEMNRRLAELPFEPDEELR